MHETFNQRLAFVRITLGENGPATSGAAFAVELGVGYWKWRYLERRGGLPRGGWKELAEMLAGHRRCKSGEVDPVKLATWAITGKGAPPFPEADAQPVMIPEPATLTPPLEESDSDPAPSTDAPVIYPPSLMAARASSRAKPASPALPLVEAALAGRADPMQTLRIVHAILKAGLAGIAAVFILAVPRAAEADGALPPGWRVLAGGATHDASLAGVDDAGVPQEDETVSQINSKKWMPTVLMGRDAA